MIFKYNKKTDKKRWESMLKYKGMFGMEFPDKISITEKDEKIAEERILEFSTLWN